MSELVSFKAAQIGTQIGDLLDSESVDNHGIWGLVWPMLPGGAHGELVGHARMLIVSLVLKVILHAMVSGSLWKT